MTQYLKLTASACVLPRQCRVNEGSALDDSFQEIPPVYTTTLPGADTPPGSQKQQAKKCNPQCISQFTRRIVSNNLWAVRPLRWAPSRGP